MRKPLKKLPKPKQARQQPLYRTATKRKTGKVGSGKDDKVRVMLYGKRPAPRHAIEAVVRVYRQRRELVGPCINISSTGMFVHTTSEDFYVGEYVKLNFRMKEKSKLITMFAQIVRLNKNPKYPLGYGINFLSNA